MKTRATPISGSVNDEPLTESRSAKERFGHTDLAVVDWREPVSFRRFMTRVRHADSSQLIVFCQYFAIFAICGFALISLGNTLRTTSWYMRSLYLIGLALLGAWMWKNGIRSISRMVYLFLGSGRGVEFAFDGIHLTPGKPLAYDAIRSLSIIPLSSGDTFGGVNLTHSNFPPTRELKNRDAVQSVRYDGEPIYVLRIGMKTGEVIGIGMPRHVPTDKIRAIFSAKRPDMKF